MINKSDLRIGNWIGCFSNGDQGTWKEFQISADTLNDIEKERLKPIGIPITEQWLYRLSFNKSDGSEFVQSANDGCRFYFDLHSNVFTLDSGQDEVFIRDIEYVHQLQNLYFDMNGKEIIMRLLP